MYMYIYIYIYICNPGHRVSRPQGTGSVGDSVGEGCQHSLHHTALSPVSPSWVH